MPKTVLSDRLAQTLMTSAVALVAVGLAALVSSEAFRTPDKSETPDFACLQLRADRLQLRDSVRSCTGDAECVHFRGTCQSARAGSDLKELISIEEKLHYECRWSLALRECGETKTVCVDGRCDVWRSD